MKDKKAPVPYEKPKLIRFGSVRNLTASGTVMNPENKGMDLAMKL